MPVLELRFLGPVLPPPVGPVLVVRALLWLRVVPVVVVAPVLLERPAQLVAVIDG